MPYLDPKKRQKYQRNWYRTNRASNPIGHREKRVLFTCRLPEPLIARIRKLVDEGIATGKYPWRSMAAAVLALILGGFERMKGDEYVDEMLPYLRSMSHIDGIRAHRSEAQAAVSRFKTEISELLHIKAVDEAATYFHTMIAEFEDMPPNVWRDWMLKEAKRAFPQLIAMKPKSVRVLHPLHKRATDDRRHRHTRRSDRQ